MHTLLACEEQVQKLGAGSRAYLSLFSLSGSFGGGTQRNDAVTIMNLEPGISWPE